MLKLVAVRVDASQWARFVSAARVAGSSASEQVRRFVDSQTARLEAAVDNAVPLIGAPAQDLSRLDVARAALAVAEKTSQRPAPVATVTRAGPVPQRGFGDVPPSDDWEPA